MFDVGLGSLVTYNPTVVAADTSLQAVGMLFERQDIRHAPVVDDQRRVVGIVSLLDVQRAKADHSPRNPDQRGRTDDVRVRDIMQSPVVTVPSDDTPLAALRAMLTHGFHSVPVVTDGRLVGMVTTSDFLRELSHSDDALLREPLVKHVLGEKAQIAAAKTMQAAGIKMDSLGVDYLAVVEDGLPVGYVSRRDLVILTGQDTQDLSCRHVAETFHQAVPAVPLTAPLGDALRTLLEKRSKVALVVDRQNRCRGLLSVTMLLAAMAGVLEEAAHCATA